MIAEDLSGQVCIANIGGAQRRLRLVVGLVTAAAAAGLIVTLVGLGAPRLWRLAAVPLVWMAAVGILQYRGRT